MAWDDLDTRTSADVNAAADINQLQLNANALKGGTPATAPSTDIETLASDLSDLDTDKLAISDLDDTPADDADTAVTSKWIYDNIGTSPAFLPTGTTISLRQDSTAPSGFLYEDGSAISRTTYAELFTAIGTVYGVGDGSTTFNLPDSREAVDVGIGTRGSGVTAHDTYTIGQFKDDQFETHVHSFSGPTVNVDVTLGVDHTASSQINSTITGAPSTGRIGTTTHGKQLGVKKYIKY